MEAGASTAPNLLITLGERTPTNIDETQRLRQRLPNFKEGELVLLQDDNSKRGKLLLGRITKVMPGRFCTCRRCADKERDVHVTSDEFLQAGGQRSRGTTSSKWGVCCRRHLSTNLSRTFLNATLIGRKKETLVG